MPGQRSKEKTKKRRVTFLLKAPEAKEAMLMGDFNGWDKKSHPMKTAEGGMWKKILMLTPGRYEYKFLVDGEWRNDPENELLCPNDFGTHNNLLTVSKK